MTITNLEQALENTSAKEANKLLAPLLVTGRFDDLEHFAVTEFIANAATKYLGYSHGSDRWDSEGYRGGSDDADSYSFDEDSLSDSKDEFGTELVEALKDNNDLQDIAGFDEVYELAKTLTKFDGTKIEFVALLKKSTDFADAAFAQVTHYSG